MKPNTSNKALMEFLSRTTDRFVNYAFPIRTTYKYDVIVVDKNGNCFFVKAQYTESKQGAGNYCLYLERKRRLDLEGHKVREFDNKGCDLLFVLCPDCAYLIPSFEIVQKKGITLKGFDKYRL